MYIVLYRTIIAVSFCKELTIKRLIQKLAVQVFIVTCIVETYM